VLPIIGPALDVFNTLLDKFVTDKTTKTQLSEQYRQLLVQQAMELSEQKHEEAVVEDTKEKDMYLGDISVVGEVARAQAQTITAEAKSEHWLAATWRPLTMTMLVGIVANDYLVGPYLHSWFGWDVVVQLPERFFDLLEIGLGGYIGGRTIEKIFKTIRRS
jgi:hypothetical protein